MRGDEVPAGPGILSGSIVFEGFISRLPGENGAHSGSLYPLKESQERWTRTARGGVRGLHLPTAAFGGRLVRCAFGAVVDISIDLRPSSSTYRLWMSVVLDDVDHRSVWLPAGIAHGYQALTEAAEVSCRFDRASSPECQATIRHDDPDLAIPWPLAVTGVTGPDAAASALAAVEPMLSDWFGGEP